MNSRKLTKLKKMQQKQAVSRKGKKNEELNCISVPFPSAGSYKKESDADRKKRKDKINSKDETANNKKEKVKTIKKLETSLSDLSLKKSQPTLKTSPSKPTVTSIAQVINQIAEGMIRNVIVMAGAGISTQSGIPDFRSPETGLYANLQRFKLKDPCDIFDLDFFLKNPLPFFELAKELYPNGKYWPNESHFFIKILHDHGILRRLYTQNIDGLERVAKIPANKMVESHGTFSTATCIRCSKQCAGDEIKKHILDGNLPRCHMTGKCNAVIKPDIVFFGEDLPQEFYNFARDFRACDLLIVMGTSLQVTPFSELIDEVPSQTPRILLNREKVGPFVNCKRKGDFALTGDLGQSTRKILDLLGWEEQLDKYLLQQSKDKKQQLKQKSNKSKSSD